MNLPLVSAAAGVCAILMCGCASRAGSLDLQSGRPNGAAGPAKAECAARPERGAKALEACGRRPATPDPSPPVAQTRIEPSPLRCEAGKAGVTCAERVVVEARSRDDDLRPLASSALSAEDLRVLGPDVSAWIEYAQRAAGAPLGQQVMYVDGMPASAPIDRALVSRVAVNEDPVSAEYSAVNEVRVDVQLSAPDRRWHFDTSMPSLATGGGSTLAPSVRPQASSLAGGFSGPIAGLPLTFSVHASRRRDARAPVFASAATGQAFSDPGAPRSTSGASAVTGTVVFATTRLFARAVIARSDMSAEHAGIGGIVSAQAGQHLQSGNTQLQGTWRLRSSRLVQRGGLSFSGDRLDAASDSPGAAVFVTGQLVTGGAEVISDTRRSSAWSLKHVLDASAGAHPWKAGVEVTTNAARDRRVLNPFGRYQVPTSDAVRGAWFRTSGVAAGSARATSGALFAERLLAASPRLTVRTGARADWQNGDGVILSPRVAAATRRWGVQLVGSAGSFVERWTPDVFATAALRSGVATDSLFLPDVSLEDLGRVSPTDGARMRTRIAPGFARRRDFVVRSGASRRVGILSAALEHAWTFGQSLPGAVRVREGADLLDVVSSLRRLRRQQTHVRLSAAAHGYSVVTHYELARSFDDSDSAFALPAHARDAAGEWGYSLLVPRHAIAMTASAPLPGGVRLSAAADARSGLRYNIITGTDPEGLGAFTDRGGRARNAGVLPSTRNFSLYASRTIQPRWLKGRAIDLGVRADNVSNRINVTSVGRVAGSPLFGQPLSATPGRSIRLWATLGH